MAINWRKQMRGFTWDLLTYTIQVVLYYHKFFLNISYWFSLIVFIIFVLRGLYFTSIENRLYWASVMVITMILQTWRKREELGWGGLWYITYMLFISLTVFYIQQLLFLNRKKFDKPVYLAFSKRPMLCKSYFNRSGYNKHWMLVIHGFSNKWWVFHAKGEIITDLKESMEVESKEWLDTACYGFYPLGFTSRKALKEFRRKKGGIFGKVCWTCQQYVTRTSSFFIHPEGYSQILTKYYGHFTFSAMAYVILLLTVPNWYFGWKLPLEFVLVTYYMADLFDLKYFNRGFDREELFNCVVAAVVTFLLYEIPFHKFGEMRIFILFLCYFPLHFIIKIRVPPYECNSVKLKK